MSSQKLKDKYLPTLLGDLAGMLERHGRAPSPQGPIIPLHIQNAKCKICYDTGHLRRDLPVEHPEFGMLAACACQKDRRGNTKGQSGLYAGELEDLYFRGLLRINGVDKALSSIKAALKRRSGFVYLWGPFGTAKTRLLKTAVAEGQRSGLEGRYRRMVDLLDELRGAFDQEKSGQSLIERAGGYADLPLLALDEIDRHKATDWTQERVFQLLDRRYAGAEMGLTLTLIAGNLPPDALDGYLASRVNDGRFSVIHLDGVDVRPGLGGGQ